MSQNHKVAIVTGASQGIGAGIVQGFISRGYRVVANSRSIRAGTTDSPNIFGVPGDISNSEVAQRVVQTAIEQFGRVDTLINNAGIFVAEVVHRLYCRRLREGSGNESGRILRRVTQHAVRQMLKQGSGHIVQITTSLVNQPIKGVNAALRGSWTKGDWTP